MGYYIQTPRTLRGKAEYIIKNYDAFPVCGEPQNFNGISKNQIFICVVDNGSFEAAAIIYNQKELKEFTRVGDTRHKVWLVMNKDIAEEMVGPLPA